MAVKLLVPWLDFKPGDVVDRGEATDVKLISIGFAEKIHKQADRQPKEKRNGSA